MKFIYTVWLSDLSLPDDDPERDWPACIIIDGATAQSSKEWGDHLAETYASSHEQCFLSSAVEPVEDSNTPRLDTPPVVAEGEEATDAEIGW